MARDRTCSLYLQLVRRQNYSQHDGDLRVVSATSSPPAHREPNSVVVKIRVVIPDEAFDPARYPTAEVSVPLAMLSPAADSVIVEATDVSD